MSYLALYRKWRPKTFGDVKGQDAVVKTLRNQCAGGRIGHAYLFCGTRGTGKTSVAKIMARAVNCEHPVNGEPCNECAMCRAILADNSMNVREIDAASNNGVDNIRDIRDQVQYPPTEGKYRVYIIDEVHMLSPGAFNALLKTLEEPPEYVIFILATTEVNKIPVTVLSRCQRYDFRRISVETITERLKDLTGKEGVRIDERALGFIARSADGAMRDALSLLDECIAFHPDEAITYDAVLEILGAADVSIFRSLFEAIVRSDTGAALAVLEDAFLKGRELGQFVNDFLWYLRNLLVIKTADRPEAIIDSSEENLEIMRGNASQVSKEALMRYIRIFAELSNRMRFSAQKRVMTELAVIRLTIPRMDETNDAVLERMADLERELKQLKSEGVTIRAADTPSAGSPPDAAAAAAVPKEETVILPKGEYADFMTVKNDWGRIIGSLGGVYSAALGSTTVEPDGSGAMCIVFNDAGKQRFAGGEAMLGKLRERVAEQYGKDITFRVRARKQNEPVRTYAVTRSELEEAVHFPIDAEE